MTEGCQSISSLLEPQLLSALAHRTYDKWGDVIAFGLYTKSDGDADKNAPGVSL